ncbi:PRC-barrel domain-containing protein [Sphingomonas sp. DT-207]|uniref:PRC-barrel domain-containing protein n=1 Tax=Sphingomonas sp. DT-207 TaxID=3396167 RepID=UPI003F1AC282
MDQMTTGATLETSDNPLILSSRVIKTPVFNREGTRLGHVDDLSIEKTSGRTIYAIMSFGGFLGIGEKFNPVPWSLLDYDIERGGFVVPLDEAELRDAPNYDAEELRKLGGEDYRQYRDTIFGYYGPYGAMPYW